MNEEFKRFLQGAKKKPISEHFTLFSVCNSQAALAKNIDNRPTAQVVTNSTALAKNILEKLYKKFGITQDDINSWYRCDKLNGSISGSSSTSQHPKGQAVDFTPKKHSLIEVFNWIKANLIYDQLIFEGTWIHVSFSLVKNRKQSLKLVNGKYLPA